MFGLRLTQRIGKLSTTAMTTKQTINSFTMVRSMSSNTNKTQLTQTKWNSLSQVRGFAHRTTIDAHPIEVVKGQPPTPAKISKEARDLIDREIKDLVEDEKSDPDWEVASRFLKERKWNLAFDKSSSDVTMTGAVGTNQVSVTFNTKAMDEEDSAPEFYDEPENDENDLEDEEGEQQQDQMDEQEESPMLSVKVTINIADTKSTWELDAMSTAMDPALMFRKMRVKTEKDQTGIEVDMLSVSNEVSSKIYDFLFSLGVDEGLAHFVRSYAQHSQRQSAVDFLQALKHSLPAKK